MSTASAVLRHSDNIHTYLRHFGTYVYCFGGIETTKFKAFCQTFWYLCLLLRRY